MSAATLGEGVHVGRTAKNKCLLVGVVSLVLVAVVALPGCGEAPSTVGPKTKAAPAVDRKTKLKIDGLITDLDDEKPVIRATAAMLLGEIGPPAKKAVPALTTILYDDNSLARVSAAHALGRIDPTADLQSCRAH